MVYLYRLAAMLRQLAQYHAKDPKNLFMVRLAQGLTHLGKGTMTLSPYHSNRSLMSPVAVAGLLATCLAFLDSKTCKLNYIIYFVYNLEHFLNLLHLCPRFITRCTFLYWMTIVKKRIHIKFLNHIILESFPCENFLKLIHWS